MELSKELNEKVFEAIEIAKTTGKLKKGTNEVTKSVERGIVSLVVVAKAVYPNGIIMHLAPLCKEKDIPYVEISSKDELGTAAGLERPTSAVAIIQEGEAKNLVKEIVASLK